MSYHRPFGYRSLIGILGRGFGDLAVELHIVDRNRTEESLPLGREVWQV